MFKAAISQNQLPGVFYKESVIKNFPKFTGKNLFPSLFFFNKFPVASDFQEYLQVIFVTWFHDIK